MSTNDRVSAVIYSVVWNFEILTEIIVTAYDLLTV